MRSRRDSKIAVKAGAGKLAAAFYSLLTKGVQYVEQGVQKYQQQLKEKDQKYLQKLALKHGLKVVEIQKLT